MPEVKKPSRVMKTLKKKRKVTGKRKVPKIIKHKLTDKQMLARKEAIKKKLKT